MSEKLTRPSTARHPAKDLDPRRDGRAVTHTHMYLLHVPYTVLCILGLQFQRARR